MQRMTKTIVDVINSAKSDIIDEIQKINIPLIHSTDDGSVESDKEVAANRINKLFSIVTSPPPSQPDTISLGPMKMEELTDDTGNSDSKGPMKLGEVMSHMSHPAESSEQVVYLFGGGNHTRSHKRVKRVRFRQSQRKRTKRTTRQQHR